MQIDQDIPLADWCTLGIGGPARWFCGTTSADEVVEALAWAREHDVPLHVLGGGSNVLFADRGFDGLVVHVGVRGIASRREGDWRVFRAGAGEPWDPFVRMTVEAGCAGLECLSGIPGLVGGTPVQNVGAYGQDVSETITVVRAVDRRREAVVAIGASACGFGYRTSRFKHAEADRFVVVDVEYALCPGGAPTVTYGDVMAYFEHPPRTADPEGRSAASGIRLRSPDTARGSAGQAAGVVGPPSLAAVREAILAIRRRKGMVIEPGNPANRSVGSFFVNPVIAREHYEQISRTAEGAVPLYALPDGRVKVPAAWLIERAGFHRGHVQGPVGISPFQAQGLINRGGARADDLVNLALAIKQAVWTRFRIALVPEPVFVGFAPSAELQWLVNGA